MALKSSSGAFRYSVGSGIAAGNDINLYDTAVIPGLSVTQGIGSGSVWSPGATQIDAVALTPTLTQDWTLLSVSVTAFLTSEFFMNFGLLGRLIMALLPNSQPTSKAQSGGFPALPWVAPMLPLPADMSLAATLWDGNNDSAPPQYSSPGAGLPVSGTVSAPVPIPIRAGQTLGVGLWLTPMLMGSNDETSIDYPLTPQVLVVNATYNVNYDDGQQ